MVSSNRPFAVRFAPLFVRVSINSRFEVLRFFAPPFLAEFATSPPLLLCWPPARLAQYDRSILCAGKQVPMPLMYRIDSVEGIVTITGDYADATEWRELLTAVGKDPNFRRGGSFLRDQRASEHPVSAETVIGIIAVVREFWTTLGVYRAAIVTRYGIDNPAMIAEALAGSEQIPLRAFTSYDDALRWLRERSGQR